jgi:hypothetical protein
MKPILPGLLIFLIIAPVVCAETCELKLQIGEEGTCSNYKIGHDYWEAGDQDPYQIAHFHLWRLSPPVDLGSDSLDMLHESEKYYDGNKLYVNYHGYSTNPMKAKYTLEDLTPQLVVKGNLK